MFLVFRVAVPAGQDTAKPSFDRLSALTRPMQRRDAGDVRQRALVCEVHDLGKRHERRGPFALNLGPARDRAELDRCLSMVTQELAQELRKRATRRNDSPANRSWCESVQQRPLTGGRSIRSRHRVVQAGTMLSNVAGLQRAAAIRRDPCYCKPIAWRRSGWSAATKGFWGSMNTIKQVIAGPTVPLWNRVRPCL